MKKIALNPPTLRTVPGLSRGVIAGGFVHLSGAAPLDRDGNLVGGTDPAAQARQCFENIRAVLAEAGVGLDSIVKLNCFATRPEAARAYVAAKRDLFADPPPASSTVIVAALMVEGMQLEVDVLALAQDES
jgi:enamine deaminase RidA (YjgF/YER057c/UK114 family)